VLNVVKAAPDGYTLLMAAPSLTISASYARDLTYDPVRDLAPVGQATTGHYVLVTHPSLPVNSVKELIAFTKARPGQLNFGSGGNGNSTHLAMEYFKSMTGSDLVHIPYKGSGAAVTDLIAGQIHLMFANITAAVPHVKSGKMRGLAASGDKRSLALPHLPTVAEAGVPGYAVTSWFGIAAPARTPQEVIAKLNAVLTTAMNARDMRDRLAGEAAAARADATKAAEEAALLRAELETARAELEAAKASHKRALAVAQAAAAPAGPPPPDDPAAVAVADAAAAAAPALPALAPPAAAGACARECLSLGRPGASLCAPSLS
jgi:tripartite-type tricarboxylate transporter receptor subunit TctC